MNKWQGINDQEIFREQIFAQIFVNFFCSEAKNEIVACTRPRKWVHMLEWFFFSRIRTKKIAKVSIEKNLKLYDFEI